MSDEERKARVKRDEIVEATIDLFRNAARDGIRVRRATCDEGKDQVRKEFSGGYQHAVRTTLTALELVDIRNPEEVRAFKEGLGSYLAGMGKP
jgi:hypothetical protein